MKIALCAIAKCENDYIDEWVRHHINLGFDKILLYDNNDPDYEFVGDRISKGYRDKVDIIDVRGKQKYQQTAYNDACIKLKDYDWVAIWDIDEFLTFTKKINVKEFLSSKYFSNFSVIRLNWQVFKDNIKLEIPDLSIPLKQRFLEKSNNFSLQAKSIFSPKKCPGIHFISVHYPVDANNKLFKQCLPNGHMTNGEIRTEKEEKSIAYLSHYMTKSIVEFVNQKLNRSWAAESTKSTTGYIPPEKLDLSYYTRINELTKEKIIWLKKMGVLK